MIFLKKEKQTKKKNQIQEMRKSVSDKYFSRFVCSGQKKKLCSLPRGIFPNVVRVFYPCVKADDRDFVSLFLGVFLPLVLSPLSPGFLFDSSTEYSNGRNGGSSFVQNSLIRKLYRPADEKAETECSEITERDVDAEQTMQRLNLV